MQELAVVAGDDRVLAAAEPAGAPDDRVEDGLDSRSASSIITARESRSLPSAARARRPQLAVPRLQLLEQSDVLDGDDGLVGEGLKKGDLAIAEQSCLGAADARLYRSPPPRASTGH
jgi:hypothetical protein